MSRRTISPCGFFAWATKVKASADVPPMARAVREHGTEGLKFRTMISVAPLMLSLILSAAQAQTVEFIHTDALGSVVAITDSLGQVTERREYEPYGVQLAPTTDDGPGYAGHVQDAATELTYMQQRYYDPQLGIFLSVDPVAAYDKPISNYCRYCYGRNNPYSFVDPDGKDAFYFQDVRTLVIPVHFTGSAATAANIDRISKRMSGLKSDWGGMRVVLQVLDKPGGRGTNIMNLAPEFDYVNYYNAGEGVNGFGGNKGHINSSRPHWIGAVVHDIMHFAGAEEGYKESGAREDRFGEPGDGYSINHIMADRRGTRLTAGDHEKIVNNETTQVRSLSGFKGVRRIYSRHDALKSNNGGSR